jgi:ATP-dependent RNA helicase DeaD
MLRIIERATRHRIEQMNLPSIADVNEQRVTKFKQRITAAVEAGESTAFRELIEEIEREQNVPAIEIAAALASLLQGGAPLLLTEKADEGRAHIEAHSGGRRPAADDDGRPRPRGRAEKQERRKEKYGSREGPRERFGAARGEHAPATNGERDDAPPRKKRGGPQQINFETFRIEVGHVHGVKPGNIVGAIANEAGLEGRHIGHVDIHEDHSFVDLPEGMPKEIFRSLKKVRVVGRELQIALAKRSSDRAAGEGIPSGGDRAGQETPGGGRHASRKPHRSARQE